MVRRVLNPSLAVWAIVLALNLGGWLLTWVKTDIDPGLLVTWLLGSAAVFALAGGVLTRHEPSWVTLVAVLLEWGIVTSVLWSVGSWTCPTTTVCSPPVIESFGPALLTSPIVLIAFLGRFSRRRAGRETGGLPSTTGSAEPASP